MVLQNASFFNDWEGALAIVVEGLSRREVLDLRTGELVELTAYAVNPIVPGNVRLVCEPHQLRRLLDPPTETQIAKRNRANKESDRWAEKTTL